MSDQRGGEGRGCCAPRAAGFGRLHLMEGRVHRDPQVDHCRHHGGCKVNNSLSSHQFKRSKNTKFLTRAEEDDYGDVVGKAEHEGQHEDDAEHERHEADGQPREEEVAAFRRDA